MSALENVINIVTMGRAKKSAAAVQEALDSGVPAEDILNGMIRAMDAVGESFTTGEIYVPEMLSAAKAMKIGVDLIKPYLASGSQGAMGKVIIGTVKGDLHDIGKNLVAMMIESAGFEVIDLGVDVPHARFVEAYNENPDTKIIAVSALLTTTMPSMREAVALLNKQSFRKDIKIMVGGAPITEDFCKEIDADCYTKDAASAAQAAKDLVS